MLNRHTSLRTVVLCNYVNLRRKTQGISRNTNTMFSNAKEKPNSTFIWQEIRRVIWRWVPCRKLSYFSSLSKSCSASKDWSQDTNRNVGYTFARTVYRSKHGVNSNEPHRHDLISSAPNKILNSDFKVTSAGQYQVQNWNKIRKKKCLQFLIGRTPKANKHLWVQEFVMTHQASLNLV